MKHLIFILFCFSIYCGYSQENETPKKVGLVLSGGGAKGLAHIGALKVIDSLNIKVDYVAGTSMGAIIGSLYASGYSGNQLDSIFNSVDFDAIINDDIPRASKALHERSNDEKYALTLPFNKFKLKLPSALSRGQNTYNLLSKLMLPVNNINNFSQLPIPFFCIATNIETGEMVQLEQGNLAQAVLASGALPSLFQPVMINNTILIDGGVVNNYPIDEMKAKGIDFIIGIDVQDDLAKRDELNAATDVLLQINNYRTVKAMKEKVKKTNVYIKPNIKDFSVISFNEGRQIIESGSQAALAQVSKLKEIATRKKPIQRNIKSIDSLNINSISIKGNTNYTKAYILGKLKLKEGETISYNRFLNGTNNLIATNNFDSFSYNLEKQENNSYNLTATVTETEKTTFLKAGIHYDKLYKTAVLLNLTKKRLLTKNDVALFDLILGDNTRYNFEYFIDNGFYWSIGLKSAFNQFNKNVAPEMILTPSQLNQVSLNRLDVNWYDLTNQFYIQTLFQKDFSLALGAEHKFLKIDTETYLNNTNRSETAFEKSNYFSVFGNLVLDTYNNKHFPSKGFYFNGDFHLYFASSDYTNNFEEFSVAKAQFGFATKLFKNASANLSTEGGFQIGNNTNPYLNFYLGGYGNNYINNIKAFYGYDFLTLTGNSYVKANLTFNYNLFKNHHINTSVNVANIGNNIFKTDAWLPAPDYSGYALGYGYETFLGPIEIKYSYSPEVDTSVWYFNVGFWF